MSGSDTSSYERAHPCRLSGHILVASLLISLILTPTPNPTYSMHSFLLLVVLLLLPPSLSSLSPPPPPPTSKLTSLKTKLTSLRHLTTYSDAFPVLQQSGSSTSLPPSTVLLDLPIYPDQPNLPLKTLTPSILIKSLLIPRLPFLLNSAILRILNTSVQILPSILLRSILLSIEIGDQRKGIQSSILLFLALSSKCIIENLYFTTVVNQGLDLRSQLTSTLYNRTISSSNTNTLSLLTTDIPTLESTYTQLHTLWDAPLQCFIYIYLLYRILGKNVINGLLILLFTIPLSTFFVRRASKIRRRTLPEKDERFKQITSFLQSKTVSKMLRSENSVLERTNEARKKEVKGYLKGGIYKSLNSSILGSTSSLILALTLISILRSGQVIKASTIFTAVSLFNQLRFPLLFYPMLMNGFR